MPTTVAPARRPVRRLARRLAALAALPLALAAAQPDPNRAFLRAMVDHHAGALAIVDAAMPRLTDTPKKDARPLRDSQAAEQRELLRLLRSAGDTLPPVVGAADRATADELRRATFGGVAARAFYMRAVAHHRAGIELIDRALPGLTGDAKAIAERMRASHEQEMAQLKRRGGV
jgi:uncharacterized protein (DUF305 family)